MMLRQVVVVGKNITKYRRDLYKIAIKKGFTDPQVLTISKHLDKEIMKWQKLLSEIDTTPKDRS